MSPTIGRPYQLVLIAITLAIFSVSCKKDSSTEPIVEPEQSYTPLNVGDVKQIVRFSDSLTFFSEIVGTTKRTDGTVVFHFADRTRLDTLHYYGFVRDGFLIVTELDTLSNYQRDPKNPFREQRLARSSPQQGESWKISPGIQDTNVLLADNRSAVKTACGTFSPVYAFILQPRFVGDTLILITYYAPNLGYIGTDTNNDRILDAGVVYAKIGGHEYGTLWPVKWPDNRSRVLKTFHFLEGAN